MKIRTGFVSNSSSSSFVIFRHYVSDYQLDLIYNHDKECERVYDAWIIRTEDGIVTGETSMDNFDMEEYLIKIGIDLGKTRWGEFL